MEGLWSYTAVLGNRRTVPHFREIRLRRIRPEPVTADVTGRLGAEIVTAPTATPSPSADLQPTVEALAREMLAATPSPTKTLMPTPSPAASPAPTATPTPTPTGPRTSFGPGVWIVSLDIAPGTYRSSTAEGCYWERLKGFGGTSSDRITNEYSIVIQTVTIAASDVGFNAGEGCGTWSPAPTSGPAAQNFGPGVWMVGVDIAPGTYRSSTAEGCYWERLKGFGGTSSDRITNEHSIVIQTVTIAASDVGFNAGEGCGTWSPVPTSGPAAQNFGPGVWMVGVDIAPGTYRSSTAEGCYWERLKGFGGTSSDRITNEYSIVIQTVTIAASDVGFNAGEGCGTWSRIAQ